MHEIVYRKDEMYFSSTNKTWKFLEERQIGNNSIIQLWRTIFNQGFELAQKTKSWLVELISQLTSCMFITILIDRKYRCS